MKKMVPPLEVLYLFNLKYPSCYLCYFIKYLLGLNKTNFKILVEFIYTYQPKQVHVTLKKKCHRCHFAYLRKLVRDGRVNVQTNAEAKKKFIRNVHDTERPPGVDGLHHDLFLFLCCRDYLPAAAYREGADRLRVHRNWHLWYSRYSPLAGRD